MPEVSFVYCGSSSVDLFSSGVLSRTFIVTELLRTTFATRGSLLLCFYYLLNASCFYNSQPLLELSDNSST